MKSSRSTARRPSRPHAPWRATRALPVVFPQALRLRPRSSWGNVRKTRARPSWRLCRRSRNATSQPFYSKVSRRNLMVSDQPRRPRTLNDARTEAENAVKKVTKKEQVALRIDQDVLEYFREGGAGWQDRINDALRKAAGKYPESRIPL